ncbi:MAG TPA: efflux RND transporter periplasmic adaptor subunit [Terriglobia bacterium]|nr:efflux RND transporter periplasmic adaptor subunit [Terriglobia bacterium]
MIGAAVIVISSVTWGAVRYSRQATTVPTAEVKVGEFVDHLQLRGELKPLKSKIVTAPSTAGSDVQIVKLVKNGDQVKAGDLIVQFDVTTLQRTLDEARSTLKQAEGEIIQTRAQGQLAQEQDQTDLVKAGYDVERAKLEVSKQEIVSEIDGEKAKVNLADAEQVARQAGEKLKSDQSGSEADVQGDIEKRDKAQFDVQKSERQIAALTVRAPGDGLVTLMPNWRAGGFFSDNAPEFKEGDRAWPGAAIAELPDLSTLRVTAHIDEIDRGRMSVGQTASIRVDAVPDKELFGRVTDISTIAKMDFSSGWPPKKSFDLTIQLDQSDPRLRPGMSATIRVAVDRVPNSTLIPVRAVFSKQGRTLAYVLRGTAFEERTIEVSRRSSEEVVVTKGLARGEKVALKDPTLKESAD